VRIFGHGFIRIAFGSQAMTTAMELENMHDRPRGDEHLHAADDVRGMKASSRAEEVAVRLHAASRSRSRHFNTPVMNDAAMDIMLSLFVAQKHKRPLALVALAMANTISQDRCSRLLDDLGAALLLHRAAPHMPISLTERGERLMQEYLEATPLLAA
jgi:hypothetical protein